MEAEVQVADRRCIDIGRCDLDGLHQTQETAQRPGQVLGHPGWQENGFGQGDQVERTT